jgi:hypothetical protein
MGVFSVGPFIGVRNTSADTNANTIADTSH